MSDFFAFDWSFLQTAGSNPFEAMWYLFVHGGWLLFIWFFLYAITFGRQHYMRMKFTLNKTWIVLSVSVPRMHEQGPRAVENAFAYLAGMHSKNSWTEDWIIGRTQDTISCEIISIDGHVQFILRTTRSMRDLTEAAIYSQYPDAEIVEIEDYARNVPSHYPDEEWDVWGTEMIVANPSHTADVYPLRTYPEFYDQVSGEFKDPMAALLEGFSRLGPGEQAWYQIVLTPIDQKAFQKRAEHAVKKMKGEEIHHKPGAIEKILLFPINLVALVFNTAMGIQTTPHKKEGSQHPKIMGMTQAEKDIIHGIEMKASKIVYLAKIRFLYVAKKAVLVKSHAVHPFIGAIKQFNTNNMLSLKPESKKVGVNGALWWFKDLRNNERKHHLILAYRNRSNWAGTPNFHLNIEELASLWHFPHAMQVKAPQLRKTEAKRSEPPVNIPFDRG